LQEAVASSAAARCVTQVFIEENGFSDTPEFDFLIVLARGLEEKFARHVRVATVLLWLLTGILILVPPFVNIEFYLIGALWRACMSQKAVAWLCMLLWRPAEGRDCRVGTVHQDVVPLCRCGC
jgi:hypothetical protein